MLTSIALFIYIFNFSGSDENARIWARYTAHLSFYYFLVSFLASSLNKLLSNSFTKSILKNRRYFGISFCITHTWHLVALTYFLIISNEKPSILFLVGGGISYIFVYAMAATSTDTMVAKLGATNWKRLHKWGINYLAVIFLFTFIGRFFTGNYDPIYGIYVFLISSVYLMKLFLKYRLV